MVVEILVQDFFSRQIVRDEPRRTVGGVDDNLCAIVEVLMHIVQKLEESRSFKCGETSDCRIILVRMIFAG